MIEFIKGNIAELNPASVTIETSAGIGFLLNISLPCYDALSGKSEARLLVHEVIREDTWSLYGFISEAERTLFRLLIGVSGVGANTARILLSSATVGELQQTILNEDVRTLKSVKGIGAKTAERIIVDLKDKIKPSEITLTNQPAPYSVNFDEALAALVTLGFPKPQSVKVLKKIFEDDPAAKVETAIKKAFSMM